MPASIGSIIRENLRLHTVLRYMDARLSEPICVDDLAARTNLSSYHFERLYRSRAGESPMTTLRRLRLTRACLQLQDGVAPMLTIAMDAGYSSNAAFTHAFVKMFGVPPSRAEQLPAFLRWPPRLRLVTLPELPTAQLPYAGLARDADYAAAELDARIVISGMQRPALWTRLDEDDPYKKNADGHIRELHFTYLRAHHGRQAKTDSGRLASGLYAAFIAQRACRPPPFSYMHARIRDELNCDVREAPMLWRDIDSRWSTPQRERRYVVFVPVCPRYRSLRAGVVSELPASLL